ncbi:DUF4129 domain-containing transglutaminase family protein [Paenibacillus sp. 1001270B_150601_E10]|uniref:DUF4129 domain-containing transglutaminase family protein n=1 Tax=Paenibacillus sp. 1001270B_150601_E10 TaxID=2787079 RepID=UPI00189DABA5|nr:transglutaminase domain-containing protein [Paenibacillus sp. 1001270B_150601_E10]
MRDIRAATVEQRPNPWKELFRLHWEDRLIWLCLFVILSQWTKALIPYWYEETIQMTLSMLFMMLGVGMVFPAHARIRIPLGIVVVIYSVIHQLKAYQLWIPADALGKEAWLQLHPYIWLVGLIWMTYEIFKRSVRTGWHVIFLLVIQLIVFGILDSFTVDMLWDQVAWTIGASLLWLICIHFKGMKARFPEYWHMKPRYAIQILVSATVLLSVVITVGVSMPGVQPILMDPYTAFVMKGERPQSFGQLTNLGSEGQSGTNRALADSGYSTNDKKLGDGFRLNYSPVMTVDADQIGYWRAETKAIYQGDGWIDYEEYSSDPYEAVEMESKLRDAFTRGSQVKTKLVKQKVTMQTRANYPALFGMGTIQSVQEARSETGEPIFWHRYDGELRHFGKVEDYPTSYTLTSEVPIYTPDQLRNATRSTSYTRPLWEPYLELPDQYSPRVAELAREIVKDADNDYDRAKRIEEYLRKSFRYTTQPNINKRVSADFVESFLFEVQEGYCDYFSSAMAVMLRTLDVPTRWVKGFAPGTRDIPSNEWITNRDVFDTIDSKGQYRVTNADAHSWVEVYLGDYGWIAFEPTPGFTMAEASAAETEEEQDTQQQATPEEKEVQTTDSTSSEELSAWVIVTAKAIVWIAVGAGLITLLIRWYAVGFSLRWIRLWNRKLTLKERIVVETEMWLSYCRLKGMKKQPSETVREAVNRWIEDKPTLAVYANIIVACFEQAKYGRGDVSSENWQQFKEAIHQFKHT